MGARMGLRAARGVRRSACALDCVVWPHRACVGVVQCVLRLLLGSGSRRLRGASYLSVWLSLPAERARAGRAPELSERFVHLRNMDIVRSAAVVGCAVVRRAAGLSL